jgi:hypothetical protein
MIERRDFIRWINPGIRAPVLNDGRNNIAVRAFVQLHSSSGVCKQISRGGKFASSAFQFHVHFG